MPEDYQKELAVSLYYAKVSNLQEYSANSTFNAPAYDPLKKMSVEMQRPVISISSGDQVAERPQGTATFTITRSVGSGGNLDAPLTVYYSAGGQLGFGLDYSLTPAPPEWPRIGSVVIPANQSSVTVTLTPSSVTLDGLIPRSVVIKLLPYATSPEVPAADPLFWDYVVNVSKQTVTLNVVNQLPGLNGPVYAVKVYETVVWIPGNPPSCGEFHQLIVGGEFSMAGTTPVNNLARLNLNTGVWEPVGAGVNGPVYAIEAVERFAGDVSPDLYVGGNFTSPARSVAKWNGATGNWSALGSGLSSAAFLQSGLCRVNAIRKIGNDVWIGGRFSSAGGVASPNLAKWSLQTSSWQPLGGIITNCDNTFTTGYGFNHHSIMVTAIERGGQAVGLANNGVACTWCPVSWVGTESYYSVGGGGTYFVGQCRQGIGVRAVLDNLEGHDPLNLPVWSTPTDMLNYGGLGQLGPSGWRLLGYGGPALPPLDGNPWWPIGYADSGWKPIGSVHALTRYGGDLYVAGAFNTLSGAYPADPPNRIEHHSPFNNIFKWNNGSGWSKLENTSGFDCITPGGLGLNGPVYAMDVQYSLCSGEFLGLWVGGNFTQAGGGAAWRIAKWRPPGYWDAPSAPVITSPANGAVFNPSVNVTIAATFGASGCAVVGVEFYAGAVRMASLTSPPYSFDWNNVPVGTHVVTAVSTDAGARVALSEPLTFRVNAPPTISLTSPPAGASYNRPVNITISATASDMDGTVSRVDFYANGVLIGTDTTAPYAIVWGNAPVGGHSLTATATDNNSGQTTSTARSITVN